MRTKTLAKFNKRVKVIRSILKDDSLKLSKDRVAKFREMTGDGASSYWNTLKLMRDRKISKRVKQLKRTKRRHVIEDFPEIKTEPVIGSLTVKDVTLHLEKNHVQIEFRGKKIEHNGMLEVPKEWMLKHNIACGEPLVTTWDVESGELIIKKA